MNGRNLLWSASVGAVIAMGLPAGIWLASSLYWQVARLLSPLFGVVALLGIAGGLIGILIALDEGV